MKSHSLSGATGDGPHLTSHVGRERTRLVSTAPASGRHRLQNPHARRLESGELVGRGNEFVFGSPPIEAALLVKQLEYALLHPAEWLVFVVVLAF